MTRVLITGHRGFVGRHFYRHFLNAGTTELLGVDVVDGNRHDCRDLFDSNDRRYDLVIHCAAVVGGRTMIDGEPLRLAAEDLSIDAGLFRWALRTKPGRIVYFSSSAVYPVHYQGPFGRILDEGMVQMRPPHSWTYLSPDQTYGWVKMIGERMAAEANAVGIKTHVFRPFSGYGHDQALDYPFPSFIRRAAQREMPFDVWGPGDSRRDWVHIDDIVGCVLAAVEADVRGPLNICTGRGTTFDELAEMCMRAAGYSTPIRHDDTAPRGVHTRVGDPSLMRMFYVPRISLEEGIARALDAMEVVA